MAKKKAQITVDEAVVAKGGKPGFLKQFEDATGVTEQNAKAEQAEEHFDRRVVDPDRQLISFDKLRPMKANPRAELGDVSALVTSIATNGFIGALSVRELEDGTFEVWAGNRRMKAAKQAGLLAVPCDVYELTEVQALELNLTEQINRADLTPIEEGEACRRLIELSGYSSQQVAEKLGQSLSWVTKRLSLCGLAPEVLKAFGKGEVGLGFAQALASLPSQRAQAQALKEFAAIPEWQRGRLSTAEAQVAWLREQVSRPLADATWKLTDETLVPEAGACSACPHNSATNRMPGLFDATTKKPQCANTACFEQKLEAAYTKKVEKHRKAGAKVLSIEEGRKTVLDGRLPYSSKYVKADDVQQEDRKKRTWKQLVEAVPEEARPQLVVAQGNDGKLYELYVEDKALAAVAEHLNLKWATAQLTEEEERSPATSKASRDAQRAEQQVREAIMDEVIDAAAKRLAESDSFPLWAARLLAERSYPTPELIERVLGKKPPTDWLEKAATVPQLLALVWHGDARDAWSAWDGFDEAFVALAKREGFDLEEMVKARKQTEKAA